MDACTRSDAATARRVLAAAFAFAAAACGVGAVGGDPDPTLGPTVAAAAQASADPVTGTTVALSVLGADEGGEAGLTYSWAAVGTPPAAVAFGPNRTNAAKGTVASFAAAGRYELQVTIADADGRSARSIVAVTVRQTATSVAVSPASASVAVSASRQFAASVLDQFGTAMSPPPTFAWATTGGGTIGASGLFTAAATTGGPYTVTATAGAVRGSAAVTVTNGGGGIQYSTRTSDDHGAVRFDLEAAPPYDYFIGAWTRVVPPMGSGTKGNDYPFRVECGEGAISFVSGNFVSAYRYNANTMAFGPGESYLGDFTFLLDATTDEATCRDWVYVGWHFRRVGSGTSATQYVKYVGSSKLVDSTVTDTIPGHWTPRRLEVGSDHVRYTDTAMYIMYARVYAMDAPPTAAQVSAIAMGAATPDAAAWADWPLVSGDPADVSGHGRHLTVVGAVAPGVAGPPVR